MIAVMVYLLLIFGTVLLGFGAALYGRGRAVDAQTRNRDPGRLIR